MDIDTLERHINQLLDIELYSAEEILKVKGCIEQDKNMAAAYMMAINRAKEIISICIKQYEEKI